MHSLMSALSRSYNVSAMVSAWEPAAFAASEGDSGFMGSERSKSGIGSIPKKFAICSIVSGEGKYLPSGDFRGELLLIHDRLCRYNGILKLQRVEKFLADGDFIHLIARVLHLSDDDARFVTVREDLVQREDIQLLVPAPPQALPVEAGIASDRLSKV